MTSLGLILLPLILIGQALPKVIGANEKVGFILSGARPFVLEARIDTGAHSSSLSATQVQVNKTTNRVKFETKGVRFDLPIARFARVRSALTREGQTRPFVTLHVCLGNQLAQMDFAVLDRTHLRYPALIGRDLLQGRFAVDVSQSHVLGEPICTSLESIPAAGP